MAKLVSLVVSGISMGSVYALVSLGFLLVYKATGVVNFAQGALMTLGAYVAAWLMLDTGWPLWPAYCVALVLMFGAGVALERLTYVPLRNRSMLTVLIATLAVALGIEAAIVLWQGPLPRRLEGPFGTDFFRVAGAVVGYQQVLIVGVTLGAIGMLTIAFYRTAFGRYVRALAADRETARLHGIRVDRLSIVVWGLAGVLAGLAGILVAPLSAVSPNLGFSPMLFAFGAAIIGGFGRFSGVVIGALALGLAEALGAGYINGNLREVYPFAIMLVVIALRPEGLFGEEASVRV